MTITSETSHDGSLSARANLVGGTRSDNYLDYYFADHYIRSGDKVEEIYKKITNAPIKHMDLRSAELAKISLNSYITMKISFANTIGRISKHLGTDANKILDAIGTDKRIGHEYFKAGGAYGGPCFPRDNKAFGNVAKGTTNYSKLTDQINKEVANESGAFSNDAKYQNV